MLRVFRATSLICGTLTTRNLKHSMTMVEHRHLGSRIATDSRCGLFKHGDLSLEEFGDSLVQSLVIAVL
jgi:hypothetical protein